MTVIAVDSGRKGIAGPMIRRSVFQKSRESSSVEERGRSFLNIRRAITEAFQYMKKIEVSGYQLEVDSCGLLEQIGSTVAVDGDPATRIMGIDIMITVNLPSRMIVRFAPDVKYGITSTTPRQDRDDLLAMKEIFDQIVDNGGIAILEKLDEIVGLEDGSELCGMPSVKQLYCGNSSTGTNQLLFAGKINVRVRSDDIVGKESSDALLRTIQLNDR